MDLELKRGADGRLIYPNDWPGERNPGPSFDEIEAELTEALNLGRRLRDGIAYIEANREALGASHAPLREVSRAQLDSAERLAAALTAQLETMLREVSTSEN